MTNLSATLSTQSITQNSSGIFNTPSRDMVLKEDNSATNTNTSNVVPFPNDYLGKERNKTKEIGIQIVKTSNTTVNNVDASYEDLIIYLQKAAEITETLNSLNKFNNYDASGGIHNKENLMLREAEDKVYKVQKQFNLFKYYSLIWMFSIVLIGLFLVLGILGVLSFFPSFTGIIASIAGIIGAFLDWKSKENENDF